MQVKAPSRDRFRDSRATCCCRADRRATDQVFVFGGRTAKFRGRIIYTRDIIGGISERTYISRAVSPFSSASTRERDARDIFAKLSAQFPYHLSSPLPSLSSRRTPLPASLARRSSDRDLMKFNEERRERSRRDQAACKFTRKSSA